MLFVACPDPEMFLTLETYLTFQVMSLMRLMSLMTMVMHYQHWHRTQYRQSRLIQIMNHIITNYSWRIRQEPKGSQMLEKGFGYLHMDMKENMENTLNLI
jgi:hypothetical protein